MKPGDLKNKAKGVVSNTFNTLKGKNGKPARGDAGYALACLGTAGVLTGALIAGVGAAPFIAIPAAAIVTFSASVNAYRSHVKAAEARKEAAEIAASSGKPSFASLIGLVKKASNPIKLLNAIKIIFKGDRRMSRLSKVFNSDAFNMPASLLGVGGGAALAILGVASVIAPPVGLGIGIPLVIAGFVSAHRVSKNAIDDLDRKVPYCKPPKF